MIPKSNINHPESAKPLLCIVGPTSSGKTSLSLKLAKLFPSILASADSRQVYRGMDLVTGKDHPQDLELHGIDLLSPAESCSVSLWYRHVSPVVNQALLQGKLPILVGGTGLYFKAFEGSIETMQIPPNPSLRQKLSSYSLKQLQAQLSQLDAAKLNSLNHSDLHNPRRLIRAIEIASTKAPVSSYPTHDLLYLGLRYSDQDLYQQLIRRRVLERLEQGAISETKNLLAQYDPNLPSFSSLGYIPIIKYLNQEYSYQQMVDSWIHAELAYSKRQLTWFRKVPSVHWFDPKSPDYFSQVASLVKDWYHKGI